MSRAKLGLFFGLALLVLTACQMTPIIDGGTSNSNVSFTMAVGGDSGSRSLTGSLQNFNRVQLTIAYPDGSSQVINASPVINGSVCQIVIGGLRSLSDINLILTAYANDLPLYQGAVQHLTLSQRNTTVNLSLFGLNAPTNYSLSAMEDYFLCAKNGAPYQSLGTPRYSSSFTFSNASTWFNPSGNILQVAAGRVNAAMLYGNGQIAMYSNSGYSGLSAWPSGGDDGEVAGAASLNVQLNSSSLAVVKLRAAPHHFLALLSDGSLYGWGGNLCGQLAKDPSINANKSLGTPNKFPTIPNIVDFGGGGTCSTGAASNTDGYTAVLDKGGNVYVMGAISLGGDGSGVNWTRINISNVVKIACGYDYILALKNDGSVWGWGLNGNPGGTSKIIDKTGAYGDIYAQPHRVPTQSGKVAVGIAASWATSAVLYSDGSLESWGGIITVSNPFPGAISDIATANYNLVVYLNNGQIYNSANGTSWTLN